ncbi:MAG: hypothetical protein KAS32_17780 [Candidatus Peribacteraceae bacterium]|nr:hypothetical protein [Candidatus Peribacteraceae bacterium]
MGLPNSFSAVTTNSFTRRWGGTENGVDPYVSGYFFTHWAALPDGLAAATQVAGGNDGISSKGEIQDILKSTTLSVTLPGGTVNKAEFTGLGGIKWAVPTNVDFDNTVTIRFLEFSSLPIFAIIHGWVRMMRDYRTGASLLEEDAYTKSNYSGTLYYWTTKPDGKTVEYFACLTGLFPMKDPSDQFGGDLTAYDKLEMDIDWNVDYVWHEDWVKDRCQSLADSLVDSDRGNAENLGQAEPSE